MVLCTRKALVVRMARESQSWQRPSAVETAMRPATESREHAVVVGGSMAGLLAARILTDHFERVTLVERDRFPGSPEFRPGIPQSRHLHVLWTKGLEIIEGLRGHTSGYAVPTYAIDVPGGGGKIAVLPGSRLERDGDHILLRNYEGRVFRFPDPPR